MGGMIQVSTMATPIPINPSSKSQHQRLQQELHQDMPRPRAQRLAQPDLARALGHRDQHDIHHAHPAHRQRDRANQAQHGLQPQRKRVDHLPVFDRVPHRSRFVVPGIEVMPTRDHLAHRGDCLEVQLRLLAAG